MAKILSFPTLHQPMAEESEAIEWGLSSNTQSETVSFYEQFGLEIEEILFEFEKKRDDEVYQRIDRLLENLVSSQAEIYRLQDVASLLKNIMDIERQESD